MRAIALGVLLALTLPSTSTPAASREAGAGATLALEQPGRWVPELAVSGVTGRLTNRDAAAVTLKAACGGQLWQARVGAKQTVLLGPPLAVGCVLQAPGGEFPILAAVLELELDGGVVRSVATPLAWEPVVAVGGEDGPWPDDAVRQWADRATASSEYSPEGWSARQATGAPNTPTCGDIQTAWATRTAQSANPEWIELGYPKKVRAVGARLYLTLTPGAVREVQARIGSGWETVWKGADPADACPAIFAVKFAEEVDTDGLRIVLDTSGNSTWSELDAVELIGRAL